MMQNNKCITLVLANHIDLSLTFQIHTDYKVKAHDIVIFGKCSVVFVRCTDNNQQFDVFLVLSVVYTWHGL